MWCIHIYYNTTCMCIYINIHRYKISILYILYVTYSKYHCIYTYYIWQKSWKKHQVYISLYTILYKCTYLIPLQKNVLWSEKKKQDFVWSLRIMGKILRSLWDLWGFPKLTQKDPHGFRSVWLENYDRLNKHNLHVGIASFKETHLT